MKRGVLACLLVRRCRLSQHGILMERGSDGTVFGKEFARHGWHIHIIPGGGEANVAVSLANYGHEAVFVSKLPKHEIRQITVNALRHYGVDTRYIVRGGRLCLADPNVSASQRQCVYAVETSRLDL